MFMLSPRDLGYLVAELFVAGIAACVAWVQLCEAFGL